MQTGIGETWNIFNQTTLNSSPSEASYEEPNLREDGVVESTSDLGRTEFSSSTFCPEENLYLDLFDYSDPDEHTSTNKEEAKAFRAMDGEDDTDDEPSEEILPDDDVIIEDPGTLCNGSDAEYDSTCDKQIRNSLPKAQLERNVAELQEVPITVNTSTYRKVEELLLIPAEKYSEQTLKDLVNTVRDFSVISDVVARNAIAVATRHRIQEGHLLNKAKEVFKQVNGAGWDDKAQELFPAYSKSTRCTLMNISKIIGVENHCVAGSERLRHAYPIIKKIKVGGPDQIAAMFEHFGEVYDQNAEIKVYLDTFDRVLGWTEDQEDIEKAGDLTAPANESLDGEGVDHSTSANSAGLDEDAPEGTAEGLNGSTADEELGKNVSGNGPVSVANKPAEATKRVKDSSQKENENATKNSFLNQESVNASLAAFINSVDKLLELKPPIYKLDLIKFDEARTRLDKLEKYVKDGSAQ